MKFEVKEVLSYLKEKYQESLKNTPYISLSKYSDADSSIFDSCTFFELNEETIGAFMKRSEPVFLHPEDVVKLKFGEEEVEITVSELREFKNQDFVDLAYKYHRKDEELEVKLVRTSSVNAKAVEEELEQIVQKYCNTANREVEKVLKKKVQSDKIYLISCEDHESGGVMDGEECVASGNNWDFHPGCCGLSTYKKIKLGNWNGAGSLASILSAGLKKKIVEVDVDRAGYDLLVYGNYDPEEKTFGEERNEKTVKMSDLFYELDEVERKKERLKDEALKKKKALSPEEMIQVLKKEYGGKFYTEKYKKKTTIICFDSSRFYSYEDGIDESFERFVGEYPGWYVEIMDAESIVLFPIP